VFARSIDRRKGPTRRSPSLSFSFSLSLAEGPRRKGEKKKNSLFGKEEEEALVLGKDQEQFFIVKRIKTKFKCSNRVFFLPQISPKSSSSETGFNTLLSLSLSISLSLCLLPSALS
jgi:hypothetical protein